MENLTPKQQKRIQRLAKLMDEGNIAILEHMFDVEDEIDELREEIPDLDDVLVSIRGKDGEKGEPGKDGVDGKDGKDGKDGLPGEKGEPGRDGVDGKDGKDGLPGERGRDGVNGEHGKDGSPDTGEQIVDKINNIDSDGPKIDASHIKNLPEVVSKTGDFFGRVIGGSRPLKILDNGEEVSGHVNEINFVNATSITVSRNGRRVDITTGGSSDELEDFVSETNTLAAYPGATALSSSITSLYGSGNWRMVAHGYDSDGKTPLAVLFNTDSKEFASITWTVAGGIVTKVNRSMLKGTSDDIMVSTAGEVTSFRHSAVSWRVHLGMIFVTCNVLENVSGTYQASYIALAYSSDYGATFSLCNLHETGTFASRSGNSITVTGMTTGFVTGQPVKYTSTGTNITGLTSGTLYFAIVTSSTTFSLASTQANALAGTAISLSGDGSGTQTFTSAYDVTPGSYVLRAPSAGLAVGQHWCMTTEPVTDTRLDIIVGDYHANPNSPGGTFYYAQFTGGAGAWTAKKLRRVHRVLGTGIHAHMGYDHKIFYGDTAVNQSYRFAFDDGDDYYETSDITVTEIEGVGLACQPVNAVSDVNGRTIMSPDNESGLVLAWDDDRDRATPIYGQDTGTRSGGNESFMLHRAYGLGVPGLYYAPFRQTASAGITSDGKRYLVSKDGIAWSPAGYDTDYNDSSGIFAAVAYEDGIPYLVDLSSGTLTAKELKLVDCTPTPSAKGGTNVLTSAPTATALTDTVVTECPLIDGVFVWPTGTALAGEAISPQPANKTAKVYYIEAASGSGDEVNFDMVSTVASGNYVAKLYIMAAQDLRISATAKLTNTSDASSTTWTADNTVGGIWRECNPFYSPGSTTTLRVKIGVTTAMKAFVQIIGIHSGRLPLDDHNFGIATVPDNTYETEIPTTNPSGGGLVVSRFRLTGKFDSYAANQNSTGAIVLAEYRQDASNHIQLRMTPNATVTSTSTFTIVQTIASVETVLATETGWLNNRDDIVFGISRDGTNGGVFAYVGESNLTGDFASASIYATTVRAGSLPCDHLFSVVNGDLETRTGAELAALYPYLIDKELATITGYRTPVGVVDSSNTVYDVDYPPSHVDSDGIGLIEGFGYTYADGQITLDIAPKYFIRYM